MAGTARTLAGDIAGHAQEPLAEMLRQEHLKVVTDLETLRAALSSGGVLAVTELMTDHADFKAAADAVETLIEELAADHATFKTAVDSLKTLADETKADLNTLRTALLTGCFGAAGLAEGTNANTLKTVNAISYAIAGQLYLKAATDNIAMTAAAEQAISTYCLYLCSLDVSGTLTVTKGAELGTDTAVLPATPASNCAIGYFKIATDGATTFTSGTTDLGAAGITETYVDMLFPLSGTSATSAVAAADASAGPATLGSSAAIPSAPATLSASVPSGTAVDAAGDLTAANITIA